MAVSTIPSTQPAGPIEPPGNGAIPPLENGDRLTREEFERRYDAMPDLKKAELIEGEVYMPSPVRQRSHGDSTPTSIAGWPTTRGVRPGVEVGDNSTVRLNLENEPQPDCLLFIQPEHGGQVRIGEDGYIEGAPISSPRSPPAASAMTWGRSSAPTAATACANTSSGGCSIAQIDWYVNRGGRSSGSSRRSTGCSAARSFPVSGSTRPPWCAAM